MCGRRCSHAIYDVPREISEGAPFERDLVSAFNSEATALLFSRLENECSKMQINV